MRIRFFNTYEPVSPFYRDLLPFLAEHGLNVEVVIGAAEYRAGRPPLEQSVAHSRIAVHRTPGRRGLARTRRQKLAAMAAYLVGATARSLFGPSVDVNFFLTQPPLFSLWGLVLRRLRGQKFVAMVMDLYPDVAVEGGLLPRSSLVTRTLTWLARLPLRRADAVVVIGRCMRDRLIAAGVPAERLHLVPNWSNDAEVRPVPSEENALRRELGVDGDFVLLYSGNLGVSHTFDEILGAARLLRDEPGLRFVFVGDGSRRREVEAAAGRDGLEAVRLFPFQPAERLAESLSMGDAHFISLRPGFEGLIVPSKAYGALATGRPIIYLGDPGGEIARMVAEEDIGAVVPPDAPEQLAAVIRDYARHPERAREQGARALALHVSTYHPSVLLARYLALFRALDAAPTIAPRSQP